MYVSNICCVPGFVRYLENDHYNKCRPDKGGPGGFSGLPVDYVYNNGVADKSKPTTKILPIGSQKIDGNKSYELILGYFTTKDISPDDVHKLGWKMVNSLYPEVCPFDNLPLATNDEIIRLFFVSSICYAEFVTKLESQNKTYHIA